MMKNGVCFQKYFYLVDFKIGFLVIADFQYRLVTNLAVALSLILW